MITIPFLDTPSFKQSMPLDGVVFKMEFNYNDENDFWTMNLNDANNVPIFTGAKLTAGVLIGNRIKDERMPTGSFLVINDTSTPNREAFNNNAVLVYVSTL
jgi:hypothetical protein